MTRKSPYDEFTRIILESAHRIAEPLHTKIIDDIDAGRIDKILNSSLVVDMVARAVAEDTSHLPPVARQQRISVLQSGAMNMPDIARQLDHEYKLCFGITFPVGIGLMVGSALMLFNAPAMPAIGTIALIVTGLFGTLTVVMGARLSTILWKDKMGARRIGQVCQKMLIEIYKYRG